MGGTLAGIRPQLLGHGGGGGTPGGPHHPAPHPPWCAKDHWHGLGLMVLAGILLLSLEPWQTVLVMALCQFGAEMFIIRQYVLAQLFITPLALISTLLVVPASPTVLLRDRIIETVIGAGVGVAVVLAPAAWRRLRGM